MYQQKLKYLNLLLNYNIKLPRQINCQPKHWKVTLLA
jgi:hypothetical protein